MAEGLITEIQREAIDSKSSVSALLRKVKLAAAKLKLEDLATWVNQELKGYSGDVPEYRLLHGSPHYRNLYHGWLPIGGDPEIVSKLSVVKFGDSVASIEQIANKDSGRLISQYNPEIVAFLSENLGVAIAQAGSEIPISSAFAVLDAVRTAVLDWAIEMEKAGVHGEGMSFSPIEQKIAKTASNVFNIGSIGSLTGNLGVGNTSGDITSAPLNIEQVKNLVSQIKSHSSALENEGIAPSQIATALERIEDHLTNSDQSLLREALGELEAIVTEAAGGLISTGIIGLLHQIMGTGIPA